jgi:hypothetical protein
MVRDGPNDVDLSDMVKPEGFTFYASAKVERNSRSVVATATASVFYRPPTTEPLHVSMEKQQQVHKEILRRAWQTAEERKASIEAGYDLTTDTEINYIETGEQRASHPFTRT